MKPLGKIVEAKPWAGWVLFLSTMVIVFVAGLFAASIVERRTEALFVYRPASNLAPFEAKSELWGKYFPREYETFLRTKEMNFRSKYNGNVQLDALAEDPRMVLLWAGYAFAKDYWMPRGHAYSIVDIRNTLRTGSPVLPNQGPQPATCWTCKGADSIRLINQMGPEKFYAGKWAALGPEVVNAVGCADCHDPSTMNLRIARPAIIEAFKRQGKDISKATHQEMRSLVCAQCHVEYYFQGQGNYLTLPWDKGTSVSDIEAYYDEVKHTDWVHALSRTPMLKAQHPDWEVAQLGIHARRGVGCADCHMPYQSEGGVKFTSHHITSPLQNISATCQVCHRESVEELWSNVIERQEKNRAVRFSAEDEIVKAHLEAKRAWDSGATEDEMAPVLRLIRHAQWRWDFAVAGNGSMFHAPLEIAVVLAGSIQRAQEARVLLSRILARKGITDETVLPDISTKEKAQRFIGLDLPKLEEEKQKFLREVVPQWEEQARKDQRP